MLRAEPLSAQIGWSDASKYRCEHLLHHYHYRMGLVLGLWIPGAFYLVFELLVQAHIRWRGHCRKRQLFWLALAILPSIGKFLEMCLAAWILNIFYWFSITVLYYETSWDDAQRLFDQQANDIFGSCVKGFGPECTSW